MTAQRQIVGCPVCGYMEMDAVDETGATTFEICDCCGCEAGYQYVDPGNDVRIMELRVEWLHSRHGRWRFPKYMPPNWSADEQLAKAGLERPKSPLPNISLQADRDR